VAFTWNTSENQRLGINYHVYLKLIGGSDPVRLTRDPADEFSPAWSPDGRLIAFLRTLSANRAGVLLIPAIGGRERKLAEVSPDRANLAWFPDSRWLVVGDRASLAEPPALFLLSVESGEKASLTAPPAKCADSSPAVSPDGRALVFARFTAENISDLFLLQLSENFTPKGDPRRITFENRYSNEPAWTPDGRAIVFSSAR
jgi:Tol biopolymer transport system component